MASTEGAVTPRQTPNRSAAVRANRWAYRISRYWVLGFSLLFGLYVGLPFLAPVLMHWNMALPAQAIYLIYSFLCHQLPQRSYFLFGPNITVPLAEIQALLGGSSDPLVLRQFIGSPELGWKVAWSDRMVSMYTSMLIFAWIWYPLRRRIRRLPWQGLVLLLLPMFFDGLSHMISDVAGIGQGFRDTNAWLAAITGQAFPRDFYTGDAWGSFNSVMRLLTGVLFGLGIIWFSFPYLDEYFEEMKDRIQAIPAGQYRAVSRENGPYDQVNSPDRTAH